MDRTDMSSMSQFLYNVPGKLSWSKRFADFHLDVFWSSDYGNDSERTQTLSPSLPEALADNENEAIKERIKSALQFYLDHSRMPMLVQFWAPVKDGSQIFLSTSDFPFGLNCPGKGLRSYRKECMQYKYIADGDETNENHFGPPGRVFCRGLPEYNPNVGDYSIKEYPLRDRALSYGARGYFGLPVFESLGQRCVGVLELVSFNTSLRSHASCLEESSLALEAVELRLPDISSPYLQPDVDQAYKDIKAGLEMVCKAHNLPLAQTWKGVNTSLGGKAIHFLALTSLSYMLSKKYSSFRGECRNSLLSKGAGVVGKAYSSFTSCFCKDITRLSTKEYPLALDASKVNLTSCFAVCLRSSYTGYTVYVVEFFLPTSETACKEPWTFLDSLLATIKCHFRSFKIASGLELGKELPVEVIKLSEDDELDSFKICQTTKSPPTLGCSQNEEQHIQLHSSSQQLALTVDAITNGRNAVCPEQSIAALPLVQEFLPSGEEALQLNPPYQSLSLDVNAVQGSEKNVRGPKQTDTVVTPLDKGERAKISNWGRKITLEVLEQHSLPTPDEGTASNAHPIPQATTMQNESSMTIKAKYGADMIKFELSFVKNDGIGG